MRSIQTLRESVKADILAKVKVEQALLCIGRWTIYNAGHRLD